MNIDLGIAYCKLNFSVDSIGYCSVYHAYIYIYTHYIKSHILPSCLFTGIMTNLVITIIPFDLSTFLGYLNYDLGGWPFP